MSHGFVGKGVYCHNYSRKLYNVIGIARQTENPFEIVVVYQQLYESALKHPTNKNTNIVLPKGIIWTRNIDDFNKFEHGAPKFSKIADGCVGYRIVNVRE